MSKLIKGRLEGVFRFLENLRVFTLEQVISSLNCSVPTARVKLRQWHAHTSYNQNGRYYAMPTVPRFDENGLWHFEKVSFSRYGNLKRTVVYLINASSSGLTGNEIGDLLGYVPNHFCTISGTWQGYVGRRQRGSTSIIRGRPINTRSRFKTVRRA